MCACVFFFLNFFFGGVGFLPAERATWWGLKKDESTSPWEIGSMGPIDARRVNRIVKRLVLLRLQLNRMVGSQVSSLGQHNNFQVIKQVRLHRKDTSSKIHSNTCFKDVSRWTLHWIGSI